MSAVLVGRQLPYFFTLEKGIINLLIDNNYIDCVIQLPPNLFFGTSIATCIMILKKNKTDSGILFGAYSTLSNAKNKEARFKMLKDLKILVMMLK